VGQGTRPDPPTWHRQCDSGTCVEIAVTGKAVMIRSSAAPEVILALTRAEWQGFLAKAKEGLFDEL
jgi:hypothetical protein